MGSNKSARQQLEMIYGKGCMFRKAHITRRLAQSGLSIKGYKKFVMERHYTLKKIRRLENTMTYHHLKHRSEGGGTDIENGAIVNELAHQYMHSLPREQEEVINDMLRQYKRNFAIKGGILVPTENGLEITTPFDITFDQELDDDCLIIPAYDTTREDYEKKFNRAKTKEATRKLIDRELYKYYNGITEQEDETKEDDDYEL